MGPRVSIYGVGSNSAATRCFAIYASKFTQPVSASVAQEQDSTTAHTEPLSSSAGGCHTSKGDQGEKPYGDTAYSGQEIQVMVQLYNYLGYALATVLAALIATKDPIPTTFSTKDALPTTHSTKGANTAKSWKQEGEEEGERDLCYQGTGPAGSLGV